MSDSGTRFPLEEKLFGLIWNHQKSPDQPLWWCLADEHKKIFRDTLTAEVARRDPTARHPLGRGT